ncbi:hypothetical protein PCC9214_05742 [Planktothrix tepida]|uniref:NACHT domain-containing protein n=1 Tax=Planktothrix tepida PCC 9214 TaxID=671072 RepID=A0A1J1LUV2_9CYAN|nr:hypothetical protein [Planktothrix tepida]CAD5990218.1 hypothetical protein PCC9214_05742 [Planktothrix tepida]CUR35636.1 conserved hypothetical protein [Planktothrix tepida PCC 9214]
MPDSYDLTQLDSNTFEHLVNLITLRVLGPGSTGFAPGSDGGRDGYFEGEAPYPSETERWSGCWYIQSKFHKPHLSKDPQKWLLEKIKEEIKEFEDPDSKRQWADNWIIATNIDPSGVPETGSFDQARKLVTEACPKLENRFHIWGGRKILDFLALHSEISDYYRHFLTPGKILTEIYNQIKDAQAEVKTILRFLVLSPFDDQQHTKLEQAAPPGSTIERPGIHDLFIDLPFRSKEHALKDLVMQMLVCTSAKCHRFDEEQLDTEEWQLWYRHPSRARVWFIKGGPGQGKSTIGQYFCQIQRAALILQKDSVLSRLASKYKNLAKEIQKVAEKHGFWTGKPRIPISIELKEFAQWFGQKDKSTSRGVLTYLAEWISVGVEQQVTTGTLKRILASHSWVIVFDGLDEVPQDVKDAVALEVCRFVDKISCEANADLLTICTSRPQGYSDQFADLDNSTIELINLSPDQALACAKPVLELERSPSEAKKCFQILESAIDSPAVRQLMTTPLQAHIMAVVVRDGERPPERKWKLFANFYQVIKRREANRNLPDKRLAKLLREQDQLLKTVHNRLGFVLHARAELSKGAQTKLERDEFEKLVTGAVKQMVETEVDETIKVLMEATTDRLVLVSTPDDGNHVRFDIRPLQEFFAAEFLYESVSAEKLRQRIEMIAGDAHWREVMHFLLSALVENNRPTELAVTVQVLESLNEGDQESLRLLGRRLGRGAILAARLLQEGVLDEDKRIRQQFRKCLEPLAGFTETDLLRGLIQVNRPDSQSWLYNFLISLLQDNNPTESIGAAIVLSQILPDDHTKKQEVVNFLLASPSNYLSYVIISNSARRDIIGERQSFTIKNWFLEIFIKVLISTKWLYLTEDALILLLKILEFNDDKAFKIAEKLDFSKVEHELFKILLKRNRQFLRSDKNNIVKDYGLVEIFQAQPAWVSDIKEIELSQDINKIKGVLQVCYLVVRFFKYKSRSELIEIAKLFQGDNAYLNSRLISQLGMRPPINIESSINEQIEQINSATDEEIQRLCFNEQRVVISNKHSRKQRIISDLCKELVDDYLDIAIYLLDERIARHTENSEDSKELLNIIVDRAIKNPEVLRNYPSLWGHLLKECREHESELRNALLRASTGTVADQLPPFAFYGFKLNLPSEVSLLPHLVNALFNNHRRYYHDIEDHEILDFLSKQIALLVDNSMYLREMIYDLSQPQAIRYAGVIAFLLHPNGSKKLEDLKQPLIELCNPKMEYWYVRSIAICLRLLASEEDPVSKLVANSLLEATRADYKTRQCLHGLLNQWRESSHSPVQKAGVLDKWLSGAE